eukprot:gene21420-27451_t
MTASDDPLANPLEQSLYDPDVIVPWDMVESVVVPMSEDNTLLCPVCLDLVRIPKMTKCGHTFCNRFKCPMCAEVVCESDLKTVQFVAAPTSSSSSSTSTGTSLSADNKQHPHVDQPFSFQHVELYKGALCPQLPSVESTKQSRKKAGNGKMMNSAKLQLRDVVPSDSAPNARYCRIVHLSVASMRAAFSSEQRELASFQHQCLHEHHVEGGAGDVESLPFISEALQLLATRAARFEEKVGQATASGQLLGEDGFDDKLAGRVATIPMSDRVGSSDDLSGSSSVTAVMPVVTSSSTSSALVGLNSGAAVFVPGGGGVESAVVIESELSTSSSSKTTTGANGNNSSVQHVYQSCDGELVFLLPLCTKCLLDGAAAGDPRLLPDIITGRVLEVERLRVTSEVRQRHAFLRHLPLHVLVSMVEIDLVSTGLVSGEALGRFSEELAKRVKKRKERARTETRERRVEEDKRVAEELALRDRLEFYQSIRRLEMSSIQQLMSGPAVGQAEVEGDEATIDGDGAAVSGSDETPAVEASPHATHKSFATITQMGGHFPVLTDPFPPCAPSAASAVKSNAPVRPTAAWGSVPPPLAAKGTEDTWARGAKAIGETGVVSDSTKTKKGAKFSLLSNSSGRSYR